MPRGQRGRVQWLAEEESAAWRPLAAMLIKLPAVLDSQLQRDSGMNHFEFGVLAALSDAPARALRMSDLASRTNGSLSRLSHVVRRLEVRGWVYREPSREDPRYTNAVLTDAGRGAVAAAAAGHVALVRRLVFEPLSSAQVRQLRGICRRVVRRVIAEEAD